MTRRLAALPRDAGPGAEESSADPCELTILMPCLDEAETVATCVRAARAFLERSGVDGEVLVADNGSVDGSAEIARSAGARVVTVPARGYGSALLGGIRAARGRFVAMGDADASYDFSALEPFLRELRHGHDLVMGNRFAGGIERGAMPFLNRWLGNPVLSFLGRLFFRSEVRDFQCGLRAFHRDSILALDLAAPGMEFASEMVVKASLENLSVTEVPTTLARDGRSTPPRLRRWRDGWRNVRFLLLFCPRWLFLYPGAALMAAGALAFGLLLGGPLRVGSVNLDVNTLVYAGAAITAGFQLVSFAAFAEVYASNSGLLPRRSRRPVERILRLEHGLVLGGFLALTGLAVSLLAVVRWGEASFGDLDPVVSLRLAVPGATLVVLGVQVASASFFLSVLGLKTGTSEGAGRATLPADRGPYAVGIHRLDERP